MPFDGFDRHLDATQIQAFLDGELGESEPAARAHLDGCARCRSEVEAWSSLLSTLDGIEELAPTEGFASRVMARTHMAHLSPDRLQEYVEGLLPRAAAESVARHLSTCDACHGETLAWSDLFRSLSDLPEFTPGDAFADRVLDRVAPEPRLGLVARMRRRLSRRTAAAPSGHLAPERLQDFVEGLLPRPQMARVRAHLESCAHCHAEAEAWSGLMAGLSRVPRLSPADGFADRVMARVQPRAAVAVAPAARARTWLPELVSGLLPSTRRSWAMASTVAMAPATALTVLGVYLFTRPQVTPSSLLLYAWWNVTEGVAWMTAWAGTALSGIPLVARAQAVLLELAAAPSLMVGAAFSFSVMTLLAVWVLYRNVLSPPVERRKYASVSI